MSFSTQSLQGTPLSVGIATCAGCAFRLFVTHSDLNHLTIFTRLRLTVSHSFGYDQGIFGGLLGNDNFIATFNNPDALLQGQITATYDLGCFFGAITAMALGGRLGRVRGLWLGCLVLTVGGILQASSYHVAQMVSVSRLYNPHSSTDNALLRLSAAS